MDRQHSQRGFTLIQLSILLVVASLVMVAILPSSQTILTSNEAIAKKMNAIMVALRQYEAVNGALPCPADASLPIGSTSYGVAAANAGTTTNCSGGSPAANYVDTTNNIAIGMVPVRALGLSMDYALDAYGRDITYAVDTHITVAPACAPASVVTGNIVINDNGTNTNAVVALVSHGADGHGAWVPLTGSTGTAVRLNAGSTDTDQHVVNAHGISGAGFPANYSTINSLVTTAESTSSTFVSKIPTGTFDDLVVYKYPLWSMGTLPSSFTSTLTAPVYFAAAHTSSPYVTLYALCKGTLTKLAAPSTLPAGPGNDVDFKFNNSNLIWTGQPFNYSSGPAPSNIGYLYSVTSAGLVYNSIYYADPLIRTATSGKFSPDGNDIAMAGGGNYLYALYNNGGTYATLGTPHPAFAHYAISGSTGVAWRRDSAILYYPERNRYVDLYTRAGSGSGTTFTLTDNSLSDPSNPVPPNTAWPSTLDLFNFGENSAKTTYTMSLDPSSTYLVVGVDASGLTAGYYNPIIIKYPDSVGGSPTAINVAGHGLSNPGDWVISSAWSADGAFLAYGLHVGSSPAPKGIRVYYFNSATDQFTPITLSGTCPTSNAYAVAWSSDVQYLAVGSDNAKPLCIYQRSGTGATATLTEVTSTVITGVGASTQPAGTVSGVAWQH